MIIFQSSMFKGKIFNFQCFVGPDFFTIKQDLILPTAMVNWLALDRSCDRLIWQIFSKTTRFLNLAIKGENGAIDITVFLGNFFPSTEKKTPSAGVEAIFVMKVQSHQGIYNAFFTKSSCCFFVSICCVFFSEVEVGPQDDVMWTHHLVTLCETFQTSKKGLYLSQAHSETTMILSSFYDLFVKKPHDRTLAKPSSPGASRISIPMNVLA